MKKYIFLLLLLPLSMGAQKIDSIFQQIRREQSTNKQRNEIDAAFLIEIPATKLDTANHKIFTITGDSTAVVREIMPLSTYTTSDIDGVITVVDVRLMYRVLKKDKITKYRDNRKSRREKEQKELRQKADKIRDDDAPPVKPIKTIKQ